MLQLLLLLLLLLLIDNYACFRVKSPTYFTKMNWTVFFNVSRQDSQIGNGQNEASTLHDASQPTSLQFNTVVNT